MLDSWRPDAIVSCMFGQVIDAPIIERPAYGIYNFHPTDLAHGFGPGPTPVEDLAAHGMTSTVWTIHHVIEAVDAGGVVAVSPHMNIADPDGKLPADPLIVYDKLLEPVGSLVASLIDALSRRFCCRQARQARPSRRRGGFAGGGEIAHAGADSRCAARDHPAGVRPSAARVVRVRRGWLGQQASLLTKAAALGRR